MGSLILQAHFTKEEAKDSNSPATVIGRPEGQGQFTPYTPASHYPSHPGSHSVPLPHMDAIPQPRALSGQPLSPRGGASPALLLLKSNKERASI